MALPAASSPGTIAGYLSASEIETDPASGGLINLGTAQDRWSRVSTVQICILVRSAEPVLDNNANGTYLHCQGNLMTPADKRLRRAWYATIVLRSRVL